MIRIAVCDDESAIREVIAARLREYFKEEVLISLFESAEVLLRAVREKDCHYQLAVLDIKLGEMTGIELGKELNQLLPSCQIIYLTGYLDYAPDSYATRHIFYVYKPTMEKYLPLALEKAVAALADAESGQLVLKQKSGQLVLEKREIVYLERRLRTTTIYTAGEKVTTSTPLDKLLELLDSQAFVRCHNSFAVNLEHTVAFRRESFLMKGGVVVPISNGYYPAVREQFRKYYSMEL